MAATKPVWGIDLGQSALKAVRLRVAEGGVVATDHVYIEHARILSQPDVDRKALIEEAVKKFTDQHDLSKESIVVGVPGQHTLARFTKLPPVDKKKIPELVQWEAQQQIPFDMDDVIWDYQVFENADAPETEVGIFAMRRELLREHLAFVSSLNLEPAAVQSNPLALYNALKYDGLAGGEAVAILDIGTQNTDLIVAEGNSLWTRNIPIGGNAFTEALLKTFKLSFRKAENLKRDAAKSKYARQIFQAMRPVFADLVAEVQRSVGFFTSSRRGVKISKFLAMGSAFKLPGLQKFLQQNLGLEVARPQSFNKLSTGEDPAAAQLTEQLMSFGVAYGLALQGLGLSQITSNLLPVEIAKQVVWRKKTPWFYGAAACLALSAAIVWGRNMADAGVISASQSTARPPSFSSDETKPPEQRQPDERAVQIIRDGSKAANPVDQANEVIAASAHLGDLLNKLESMNAPQIARAEEVAKLHAHKSIWPMILQMVHSALPMDRVMVPAMREGPAKYKEAAQQVPRAKREQVFLLKFKPAFSRDVMADYATVMATRKPTGEAATLTPSDPGAAAPTGGPQPGFVITVVGRTPNAQGWEFLKKTFCANLEKAKSKGVYLASGRANAGIDLIRYEKVKDIHTGPLGGAPTGRAPYIGRAGAGYGPPSGEGRIPTYPGARDRMPMVTSGTEEVDHTIDPVTGESIQEDWEFEIVFVAVLGEKPAPSGTPGEPAR